MKTPDEIKKGLALCNIWMIDEPNHCHEGCPYFCTKDCADILMKDALTYIQQLERERDAAVANIHKTCSTCKHYYYNRQDDDTADCLWWDGCKNEDHYEWCGVKED